MKKKLLKISIIGKTNAGKSTLINKIIGETISIINKKVNTTETLISGILNIGNNQLIFYDTPGIQHLKNIQKNNKNFKQSLWNGLLKSDLIIYLIDVKTYRFDEVVFNINKIKETKKEILIVFNKCELISKDKILPKIKELDEYLKISEYFLISAKKKYGLKNLLKYLEDNCYNSDWIYKKDEVSDKDDIFITNEITRNSILKFLHNEIPYNLKIINKLFKYLRNGDLKIKQEILINNSRYKKIILGRSGDKIKEIREKSQIEISNILKKKTHLYINIVKSHNE